MTREESWEAEGTTLTLLRHIESLGYAVSVFRFPSSLLGSRPRLVRARRNQGPFPQALLLTYQHRCMISGCKIEGLLEAAHIKPYATGVDNSIANGLLLRADLHTLLDLHLIDIEPASMRVHLHPSVRREGYERFHGRTLICSSARPSEQYLAVRWHNFEKGPIAL